MLSQNVNKLSRISFTPFLFTFLQILVPDSSKNRQIEESSARFRRNVNKLSRFFKKLFFYIFTDFGSGFFKKSSNRREFRTVQPKCKQTFTNFLKLFFTFSFYFYRKECSALIAWIAWTALSEYS